MKSDPICDEAGTSFHQDSQPASLLDEVSAPETETGQPTAAMEWSLQCPK